MNYYVVVDTNVIVSSILKKNSIPHEVVDHALHGKIIPLFDEKILAEYKDVLSRKKFSFPQDMIEKLLNDIIARGKLIDAKDFDEVLPDPKDKIFYCVLMTAREEVDAYLVTGNLKHFSKEIFIVTPRELLDILEREDC